MINGKDNVSKYIHARQIVNMRHATVLAGASTGFCLDPFGRVF